MEPNLVHSLLRAEARVHSLCDGFTIASGWDHDLYAVHDTTLCSTVLLVPESDTQVGARSCMTHSKPASQV